MIVCEAKNIAVLLNPKTGTSTLVNIFKKLNVDKCNHSHDIPINVSDYQTFCFYRNPVDRFVSAVRYFKRKHYPELLHMAYGNDIKVSCLTRTPYNDLSDSIKAAIEEISIDDMLTKNMIQSYNILFKKQTYWLDSADVCLLNYHDYDNEVRKLMVQFDYYDFDIPRLNESVKISEYDQINNDTIIKIKDLYQEDYDFFASKGITFSNTLV